MGEFYIDAMATGMSEQPTERSPKNKRFNLVIAYSRARGMLSPRREQTVNSLIGIVTKESRRPTHLQHFDPHRLPNGALTIPWEHRHLLIERRLSALQTLTVYFGSQVDAEANGVEFRRARHFSLASIFLNEGDPIASNGALGIENVAVSCHLLISAQAQQQLVIVGSELRVPESCRNLGSMLSWALSPASSVETVITDRIIDEAAIRGFERDRWRRPYIYRRSPE